MARQLILIYGPPLAGKTTAARRIAEDFDDKTAVVSVDHLLREAIAVGDDDVAAELEMVHVQLRLLVANYLKNHYNVVVEGPFVFERDGRIHSYEREIGELAALMRNLVTTTLILRLKADEATLSARGSADAVRSATRVQDSYIESFTHRLTLDSGAMSPDDILAKVRQALNA
ncbi:MAG: AAA family ATPase [Dehalococcoidia bacterium]